MSRGKDNHTTLLSFDELESSFTSFANMGSVSPFVLTFWLKSWFFFFGNGLSPLVTLVREGDEPLGIAPLVISDGIVRFMGNESLCDFQDMILAGDGEIFFTHLLNFLQKSNCKSLELGALLPNSKTLKYLPDVCRKLGISCVQQPAGTIYEMDLPASWDAYLIGLSGKQRHEIRRKMRRLREEGDVSFQIVKEIPAVEACMSEFYAMFTDSRADKAMFLDEDKKGYFSSLAEGLANNNLLRFGRLLLNEKPVASVFCFEHEGTIYLYNNGYYNEYSSLSIGSLSKVFSIKYGICKGLKRYSFLKGDEKYKRQLGGIPLCLTRLIVQF